MWPPFTHGKKEILPNFCKYCITNMLRIASYHKMIITFLLHDNVGILRRTYGAWKMGNCFYIYDLLVYIILLGKFFIMLSLWYLIATHHKDIALPCSSNTWWSWHQIHFGIESKDLPDILMWWILHFDLFWSFRIRYITLVAITGTTTLVPYFKSSHINFSEDQTLVVFQGGGGGGISKTLTSSYI